VPGEEEFSQFNLLRANQRRLVTDTIPRVHIHFTYLRFSQVYLFKDIEA